MHVLRRALDPILIVQSTQYVISLYCCNLLRNQHRFVLANHLHRAAKHGLRWSRFAARDSSPSQRLRGLLRSLRRYSELQSVDVHG